MEMLEGFSLGYNLTLEIFSIHTSPPRPMETPELMKAGEEGSFYQRAIYQPDQPPLQEKICEPLR
jgi:hypothetical protein